MSIDFRWQHAATANDVRGPLGDCEHNRMDIAADDLGHDGGIHHPQALETTHPQLRVHYRKFVASYPAGTGCVLDRGRGRADMGIDVGVRGAAWTRQELFATERIQGLLPHDIARDAETVAQDAHVVRTGKIAGIDAWLVSRIRRG